MKFHILNGDALAADFDIDGEKIICRECLIDGETNANSSDEFWKIRADFIEKHYGENDYIDKTVREFEKLQNFSAGDEVNLWFGNELFCQANLWFCLSLAEKSNAEIYRVFPDSTDWNCKFDDLQTCFNNRVKLRKEDLQLGLKLWQAYQISDYAQLADLSKTNSPAFIRLQEVCEAEIEKHIKPRKILSEIKATEFDEIFKQFSRQAGVYGFGDSGVKRILKTIR
jgi:hypothetical protein